MSPAVPAAAPEDREAGETRTSPLVRRIAAEHNVDLSRVKGTGLGGRVSKKDILDFLEQRGAAPPAPAAAPAKTPEAPPITPPAVAFTGPTQVVPMTPMRRQIAEHMVASKRTSAHVYTVVEVEMTRVVAARERSKDEFEQRQGVKLTFTPFFVRACLEAIKEFPIINSSVEGTNIVYKRDVNIGIAVALESGLIVPVIKRADEKSFLGIARAMQDLADRARSKRLSVEEVQGGTFTITNPGSFGGLFGLPIIPQPQVAILGVGAIEKRPVVRDDAIAIRHMVYLSLSYDHRVIDGAVAEQFMGKVKKILENWSEAVL
jgi:2-oxoglutarate dehydrogenase E2 component (dihydrolipoamide succinyltransferase)